MIEKIVSVLFMISLFYMIINCISIFEYSKFDLLLELIDEFNTGFIEDIIVTNNHNHKCEKGYTSFITEDEFPLNYKGMICNYRTISTNNDNLNKSSKIRECVISKHSIETNVNIWKNRILCYKRSSNKLKDAKLINETKEVCGDSYKICGYADTLNQVLCVLKNSSCPISNIKFIGISEYENTIKSVDFIKTYLYNITETEFLFYEKENNSDNNIPLIYSKFRTGFFKNCFSSSNVSHDVLDLEDFFSINGCTFNNDFDHQQLYYTDDRYIPLDYDLLSNFYNQNSRENVVSQLSIIDPIIHNRKITLFTRPFLGWKKECKQYGNGIESLIESDQLLRKLIVFVIIQSFLIMILLMAIGLSPFFFYNKLELFFRLICISFCIINFIYPIQIIGNTNYIINSVMNKDNQFCSDETVNNILMNISQTCLSLHLCYVKILIFNIIYCVFVIYGLFRSFKPYHFQFQETYKKYIDNDVNI